MVQEVGLGVIECFNMLEVLTKMEPADRAMEISKVIRQLYTNPEERRMASTKLSRRLNAESVNVYSTTPYLKRSVEMMKLMQSGRQSSIRTRRKRTAAPVSATKAKVVKVENHTAPVLAAQVVSGTAAINPNVNNGATAQPVTNPHLSGAIQPSNYPVVQAKLTQNVPAQTSTNHPAPSPQTPQTAPSLQTPQTVTPVVQTHSNATPTLASAVPTISDATNNPGHTTGS
eukprot:CAMPEP_0167780188 /NCGR_PEP_ID=MMETSP0111_2-20121227/5217_1 /TAXON_ID=91324 /ORGANISM="Lotharella globosa, Strain CCCM811" /LENGTH=228 /DNA_ID=CAMNT_0007670669 /DNA_START=105 /DNA_END=791 /DNA_ORIENTATION=+